MPAIWLYRIITFLAAPVLVLHLRQRASNGREDAARLPERRGQTSLTRPEGSLIWLHAASVGETNSILPLIEDIAASHRQTHILLTTGTRSSAALVARYQASNKACLLHQYAPLDRRAWVDRFLDYWRPDMAGWVESELWPNMITACCARSIPLIMLNGRLSQRSFRRWQKLPRTVAHLLGCFDCLMAQDKTTAQRLTTLGAPDVEMPGNLKFDAPPLPTDTNSLTALQAKLSDRPVWLAASTHDDEEMRCAAIHQQLADMFPTLLTLIAPRHPERGDALAQELTRTGLRVVQRSRTALPAPDTQIYLLDTLGELGLFYRLAPITFLGGSLIAHGGQNPLEAAHLDCAIIYGPHVQNFSEIYHALQVSGAACQITDSAALQIRLGALLANRRLCTQMAANASRLAQESMSGIRVRVLDLLTPYLEHRHVAFRG